MDYFSTNNLTNEVNLFKYRIIRSSDCINEILNIEFSFNIFSSELGFSTFELFYRGSLDIDINKEIEYFKSSDFSFSTGLTNDNKQTKKLISFLSQAGELPNGKYQFQFKIKKSNSLIHAFSEVIEINKPAFIDLLYPGGTMSNLSSSIIFNTTPLFTWYSDYCIECDFSIRICEFDKDKHDTIQEALDDRSIIPWNQFYEYYGLSKNAHSFQIPKSDYLDLEEGKYYVWQVRRSYETTIGHHYDYSSIFIFEIQSPTKNHIDYSDPYLFLIESLVGNEKFDLLFNTGGELERFITSGNSVWINGNEVHIEILHSLVADLNDGKIKINNIEIK